VGGIDRNERCVAAWSSDVGHYLTIDKDRVIVNRWDRRGAEEYFSLKSVLGRLHDFHRFLENDSPGRAQSIVAHVLQVFRQIRSIVLDDQNGARSLKVFIALLASAATEEIRSIQNSELNGFSEEIIAVSSELTPSVWASLQRDLSGLGRYEVRRPDVALVLRHASGAIFQEAHRAVGLADSLWLPGLERPASLISKSKPEETGVFFTPPALARTLTEEAILALDTSTKDNIIIFDPACGSGELLKECLRLLKQKEFTGKVSIIGWDKSSVSIDMAHFLLAWEKRSWRQDRVNITLLQTDSITATEWPKSVDLVIMNPPFLSRELMTQEQKDATQTILGGAHVNRPNLAMAFALRSLESMKQGGVLAMIAPNSLLEASSGKSIREELAANLKPRLLARLGNQNIFADALVDAGIYIGKRIESASSKTAVVWSDSQPASLSQALRGLRRWRGSEAEPLLGEGFSIYLREGLANSGAPWIARDYRAWQFYEAISATRKTVPAKKLFDIKQGVRMGSDLFIVTQDYYLKLPKNEQPFFRPAVMNPSIVDGVLLDKHYIFYPSTTGLPQISNEHNLEECVPTYYRDSLKPNEQALRSRRSLHKGASWWELSEHRNWLEEKEPRLVSKYFGSERAFAFDRSGDFVIVVGNGWLLQRSALGETNLTESEVYLGMLAFLNSSYFQFLALYASVQLSGGQFDLSNRYIGNLPVPQPERMKEGFSLLIEAGQRIVDRDSSIWNELNDIILRSLQA
jgi:tRNA1(Val) A37 N6-methylase TrmN6